MNETETPAPGLPPRLTEMFRQERDDHLANRQRLLYRHNRPSDIGRKKLIPVVTLAGNCPTQCSEGEECLAICHEPHMRWPGQDWDHEPPSWPRECSCVPISRGSRQWREVCPVHGLGTGWRDGEMKYPGEG